MNSREEMDVPLLDHVLRLSDEEKYRLWKYIGDDLFRRSRTIPVPEEHIALARKRLEEHLRDPHTSLPLEEAMREIRSTK